MRKYNFKSYDQSVQMLIPPSWDEYIPINHIVRVIDSVVEKINLDTLLREYNNIY
ncbi:MAG: hypothetical protein V1773_12345 [bacterium]